MMDPATLILTANTVINAGVLVLVYNVSQRTSRIETFLYYECPKFCNTKTPQEQL